MKNIIIWIEDRPYTVSKEVLLCRKMGFEVILSSTAHGLAKVLEKEKERVALIIVDIMLFHIISLESIGIPDSFTDSGYQAGWVIIDRLLRVKESTGKPTNFENIPILILTTQRLYEQDSNRLNDIKNRGGAWIKYIEKSAIGQVDGRTLVWTEHFEIIMRKLYEDLNTRRGSES